jgi:hypothetical protein
MQGHRPSGTDAEQEARERGIRAGVIEQHGCQVVVVAHWLRAGRLDAMVWR